MASLFLSWRDYVCFYKIYKLFPVLRTGNGGDTLERREKKNYLTNFFLEVEKKLAMLLGKKMDTFWHKR